MRYSHIIICICTQYVLANIANAFPKRIPFGALFDDDSVQAHTAFRYEVEKHNNSTTSLFKLDRYEKIIDVANCFDLNKAICSTMSKGIFALFGVLNRTSMATATSLSSFFHMPYISPSMTVNTSLDIHNFILNMRPTYDRAIIDIIRHHRWPRIYYIYDTDDGLARIQHIFHSVHAQEIKVEIEVTRIADVTNCYTILRHLDSMGPTGDKYIVLDLSSEQAFEHVLRQIQNVGMNRDSYHYVLGGMIMDEFFLDDFKHGGVNITGFRLVDPDNEKVRSMQTQWARLNPTYWKGAGPNNKIKLEAALTMDAVTVLVEGVNHILRRDPNAFHQVFRRGQVFNNLNATKPGIHCNDERWGPWFLGQTILQSFKQVNFLGMTGRVMFDERGFRKNYTLDILELSLNSNVKRIGSWHSEKGLTISPPDPRNGSLPQAKNKTRIVTTIISHPYMMERKQQEDGEPLVANARYEGYCVDLAEKLSEIVQYDYVLQLVKDGLYGAKQTDGKWNGMVGELTEKKADIAIAPLTISSMRERVIDFSKPFMSLGISIMIKKPEKQKPGVFSFMDPLSKEIWMCIVFSYIGVSFILFLVSRFSPYEWQIEDSVNGPTFTNDFTILNSLWFSLGAFMRQGCDISPRSMSGRVVGSAWWFFTLIIISSYTANLAAFLTVERMLTPIESADDLAKQTEIQYGTLDAGSTKNFFQTSKIAVYERMWAFMKSAEPYVFVRKTEDGVQRVRTSKGKYAFLLESTMNDYYNQRKPCNTMKVGGNLDSKGYGVATPLGSSLREKISLAVLQLRESGYLQKLHKKWWYDKGECAAEAEGKGSSQSALTLSNVAGIFYILIGGLGLSMIVSLLEFLYKSRMESRRQKKTYAASVRSKTRLSIRSTPERENGGVGSSDMNKSMSTVPIARSSAVSLV